MDGTKDTTSLFGIKEIILRKEFIFLLLVFLFFGGSGAQAQDSGGSLAAFSAPANEAVSFRSGWSRDRVRPGEEVVLAIKAEIAAGYHVNADEAQLRQTEDFVPYPTTVKVLNASDELTVGLVQYPPAREVEVDYLKDGLSAFEGDVVFYLPVLVSDNAAPGSVSVAVQLDYQLCDARVCLLPGNTILNESIDVVSADTVTMACNIDLFADNHCQPPLSRDKGVQFDLFGWRFAIDVSSGSGLFLLLVAAAFGGLLLNFTPCVLPIIPIKIMSLSESAGNRVRCGVLGGAMSSGIVVFWVGLGGMIAAIRQFTAINQLFQYPAFTIIVGLVIASMAFGMCGHFSVRLPGFIYKINPRQDSLFGSFALGIMTAILSTPCTAPFMGAAAAWAATQHYTATLASFAAIGMGMALPYLVLSAAPQLVRKMPRTGPASELIKQLMGILMLAAASYFIGIGLSASLTEPPAPPSKAYWWAVMSLSATAGLWLSCRILRFDIARRKKIGGVLLGLAVVVISVLGALHLTVKDPIRWVHYTPERLEKALSQKKIVVMEFTAEWCLNCKALEESVLHSPRIVKLLGSEDVEPIKVDITSDYAAGKAKLLETGRLTIPLLVVYAPDGREIFKSDFYAVNQVVDAVQRARETEER